MTFSIYLPHGLGTEMESRSMNYEIGIIDMVVGTGMTILMN